MFVRCLIPALLGGAMLLSGCESSGGQLRPADFNGNDASSTAASESPSPEPQAPKPAGPSNAALPPSPPTERPPDSTIDADEAENAGEDEEPTAPPRPAPEADGTAGPEADQPQSADRSEERFIVDAMVGQVNGKPIYASEVFQAIGHEQLERLGESQPRLEFRQDAMELIITDLRSRITNALLLREAERELTEREREGMRRYLKREREKVLAQYGGVLALAEEGLERDKGRSLEEELDARRQALLVEKYRNEKMLPKIDVHRSDVERYYEDHFDEYNAAPTVTVRIIVVREESDADAVTEALADGEPFGEVAARHSDFRAAQGGLMPAIQLTGPLDTFDVLRWPRLNEKVSGLAEGEHSDRTGIDIGYGWVMLEAVEGGEGQSLQEVFLEIENRLRSRRFNTLSRRYIEDLMTDGSFTPIDRMANALLEVAMARYARTR